MQAEPNPESAVTSRLLIFNYQSEFFRSVQKIRNKSTGFSINRRKTLYGDFTVINRVKGDAGQYKN
jgi:hypothetical protein